MGILKKNRENYFLYLSFRVFNVAQIRGGNRKTTVRETPIIIFITRLLKTKENILNNHPSEFEFDRSICLNYTKHWKLHFSTTFSNFRVTFACEYILLSLIEWEVVLGSMCPPKLRDKFLTIATTAKNM